MSYKSAIKTVVVIPQNPKIKKSISFFNKKTPLFNFVQFDNLAYNQIN